MQLPLPATLAIALVAPALSLAAPTTPSPEVEAAIVQQVYLKASNMMATSKFSRSVAVSCDTAVVGARVEDKNSRRPVTSQKKKPIQG